MKKISVCLICLLFVSGCGNDTKVDIDDKIDSENLISNMQVIDDNMLKTEFGINVDNVIDYSSGINMVSDDIYVALKPKKGKEELIKNSLDNYFLNLETQYIEYEDDIVIENEKYNKIKNRYYEEYNGYYIYIVSSNNDKVLDIIKNNLK